MDVEVSKNQKKQAQEIKDQGNNLFKEGQYKEAIQKYSEAISIDPTEPAIYSNRANAQFQLQNYKQCLQDCNLALKLDPEFTKVLRRRGLAQVQLGLVEDGYNQIKQALESKKNDKTLQADLQQVEMIKKLFTQCEQSLEQEKYTDTIIYSKQLIQQIPQVQKVQMCLIEATIKSGNPENAQQLLQQYRHNWQDKESCEVYYLQGMISLYQGFSDRAKKVLTAGMQKDPDNKKCMLALKKLKKQEGLKEEANELFKSAKLDEALQKYQEAIDLDVLNKRLNAQIYGNIASVYMRQEKYEKALNVCHESIELDPNYSKAYFKRAEAKMKLEEFEAAIHDYKKYQEISGENIKEKLRQAQIELKKSKQKDYYKVLGLPKTALPKEIKKAYHKLALQFHPDRIQDPEEKTKAEKKFKEINDAYQILSDPEKKSMVDQGIDPNEQGGGGGGFPGGFHSAGQNVQCQQQ